MLCYAGLLLCKPYMKRGPGEGFGGALIGKERGKLMTINPTKGQNLPCAYYPRTHLLACLWNMTFCSQPYCLQIYDYMTSSFAGTAEMTCDCM